MKGLSLYIPSYLKTPLTILNDGDTYSRILFEDEALGEDKGAINVKNTTSLMYFRNYTLNEDGTNEGSYTNFFLPKSTYIANEDDSNDYTDIIITRDTILDKIFPINSCFITSTNTNPSTILNGGTWSLIDKLFIPWTSNSSSLFTVNSTNCSLTNIYISRAGHSIRIRLLVLPKVTLGDTTVAIGTFNMELMGITNFWNTYYPIGNSDGGGGLTITSVTWDTGVLNHQDTIHRKGNETAITSTSYNIVYDFVVVMPISHMLDSACNQFIWKRTA